jgi:hypothetical protein
VKLPTVLLLKADGICFYIFTAQRNRFDPSTRDRTVRHAFALTTRRTEGTILFFAVASKRGKFQVEPSCSRRVIVIVGGGKKKIANAQYRLRIVTRRVQYYYDLNLLLLFLPLLLDASSRCTFLFEPNAMLVKNILYRAGYHPHGEIE